MKPVPQRIVGALQDDQRGDCYKCCVASILELPYEDVPHFAMGEPDPKRSVFNNVNLWLRESGMPLSMEGRYYFAPFSRYNADDIHSQYEYDLQPRNLHPGYWIATVKSRIYPQSHHAIVMKDGKVAFDPSPSRDDPQPYEFCGEDVFVPDLATIAAMPHASQRREQMEATELVAIRPARRTISVTLAEFDDDTYGASVAIDGADWGHAVGNSGDRDGTIDEIARLLKVAYAPAVATGEPR